MVIYIEYTIWLIDFIMKDLIKKILKEETKDEYILEIPNLRFIPNVDLETPKGKTEAWNELLRLLNGKPFIFDGDLNLYETDITSLGNLQSVNGNLNLELTDIISLGNLKSVNGNLDLIRCENLTSLGNLQTVNRDLTLRFTNITSLGNLQSVGGYLDLIRCVNLTSLGNLKSVGGYLSLYKTNVTSLGNLEFVGESLILKETPISKKYSEEEIRQMVKVVGRVIL